jgi:hypothetical protein
MLVALTLALLTQTAVHDVKLAAVGTGQRLTFADVKGAHQVDFVLEKVIEKRAADRMTRSQTLRITHTLGKVTEWQAKDFVLDCEFDLTLEVVPESIEVTDLDQDGRAEVSFIYRRGCKSDVSPLEQKLLFYAAGKKYALRGTTRVKVGEDAKGAPELVGGEVKPDFVNAPAPFLPHARTQWDRFVGP